jgi:hypothetical protein
VPFRRELTRHWHASIPVLLKPHIDFVALRKRRIR